VAFPPGLHLIKKHTYFSSQYVNSTIRSYSLGKWLTIKYLGKRAFEIIGEVNHHVQKNWHARVELLHRGLALKNMLKYYD
jgi:hypothetical protein